MHRNLKTRSRKWIVKKNVGKVPKMWAPQTIHIILRQGKIGQLNSIYEMELGAHTLCTFHLLVLLLDFCHRNLTSRSRIVSFFGQRKKLFYGSWLDSYFSADAPLYPYRVQVTKISLAHFKNKKKYFFCFEKRHSFLKKNHLKPVVV
jgi:hypothetical protein